MSLLHGARWMAERVQSGFSGPARWQDAALAAGLGGALRFGCVWWAIGRFPPAADGQFYDVVARRIAEGLGYTWLWADGAVTYAAHYPVGYPALIGGLYAVFGPNPLWAMLFNAVLGTAAVVATYYVAVSIAPRAGGLLAALAVALNPSLVLYTPALMTEGVTAALYALAAYLSLAAARDGGVKLVVVLGVLLGVTTLVRPQTLILVPVFGAAAHFRGPQPNAPPVSFARGAARRWWFRATMVTLTSLAVCMPWTLRNCDKMGRCVFVSANAGWNLLIGTEPRAKGAWIALTETGVPAECRDVFDEAAKDGCFSSAALERIAAKPAAWLALVPKKWSATFDYPGAPAHYLRMSNPEVVNSLVEQRLLALETAWFRIVLALALLGVLRLPGSKRTLRGGLAGVGLVGLCTPFAWPSLVCLVALAALSWREVLRRPALMLGVAVFAATLFMHAVFFGAGRYALVCGYLAGVLAGAALREPVGVRKLSEGDPAPA